MKTPFLYLIEKLHSMTGRMLERKAEDALPDDGMEPVSDSILAACDLPRGMVAGPWIRTRLNALTPGTWQHGLGWVSEKASFISARQAEGDAVRQLFKQPCGGWKMCMPTIESVRRMICAGEESSPWMIRSKAGDTWVWHLGLREQEGVTTVVNVESDHEPLIAAWLGDWEACPIDEEGMLTDWPEGTLPDRLLPISLRSADGRVGALMCPECSRVTRAVAADSAVRAVTCCEPRCVDCNVRLFAEESSSICVSCIVLRDIERRKRQYNAGTKIPYAEYSRDSMLCWEPAEAQTFYFYRIEELERHCTVNKLEMPSWVFGTQKLVLELDANALIEDALADHHTDAYSMIPSTEFRDLQRCIDRWLERPGNRIVSFNMDTSIVVVLPDTTEFSPDNMTEITDDTEASNG